MATQLRNSHGDVYLTIEYDAANDWLYCNWLGYQTDIGVMAGVEAWLPALRETPCAYLLNDNRELLGRWDWDHIVQWMVTDWAPRAIAQGLTHFAYLVSSRLLDPDSKEVLQICVDDCLYLRMFSDEVQAKTWLRAAQQQARVEALKH